MWSGCRPALALILDDWMTHALGVVMAVPYLYKIVYCKTCGSLIDVEYLGPASNVRIAGTVHCPIELRCTHCTESHRYSQDDLLLFAKGHAPTRRH